MDNENYYFDCECNHQGHVVRLTLDPDGDITLSTHLDSSWIPWYKRLYYAVRYVFGLNQPKYGSYDCTILRMQDYDKFRDLMKKSELISAAAYSRTREQLKKV